MKEIDKNVIALGWVSFFTDMASSMVTTLLPVFVVYVLHEGVDKLGIIIAVATFISYMFRILFGYLSDRYSIVKPFVVTGYFISAITKPLLAFSTTFMGVAALRGVERMGKAVRSASKDALISANVKNGAHGKTFGFHKTMDIAGELSGATLVFLLLVFVAKDESMIRTVFEITVIPGLIATFIALFFVKDMPKKEKISKSVMQKADIKLLLPLFIYFGFVFFLMSEQFYILKAKEMGYTLEMIPIFMILLTFIQTITSYYSGLISDTLGIYKCLFLAFVFAIGSVAMLAVNLWASFVLLALFTVLSLNSIRAYISQYGASKGFMFGIFYGGVAIFSALGALAVGFIWEHYGFDKVLWFSESGMIIMLLFLIIHNVSAYLHVKTR